MTVAQTRATRRRLIQAYKPKGKASAEAIKGLKTKTGKR